MNVLEHKLPNYHDNEPDAQTARDVRGSTRGDLLRTHMPSVVSIFRGMDNPAAPLASVLRRFNTRFKTWRCDQIGFGVEVLGSIWVHGGGTIRIGNNVRLDGRIAPIELHSARHALLELGDEVCIYGGTSIEAVESIQIGCRSVLRPFVKIIDNNFHPLRGDRNHRPPPARVLIEDDVIIGDHAIILPGARVESGARIGARSVISHRVPHGARVSGNPPRIDRIAQ